MRGSSSSLRNALPWLLAGASLGRPAHAEAPADASSIELTWSGPGTEVACLGGEGLTRAVNEYLGRHAISSPPAELALSVQVERLKSGWRALIKLSDQRSHAPLGERELVVSDPRCSGLDEPLKLAVALLVDSELAEVERPEAAPQQPLPPPEPEVPEPEPEPQPEPPLFPTRGWQFGLDASVLAAGGVLASTAAGLEVGFDASPVDWLSLRAHAAGFVPQSLAPGGSARVNTSVVFAGAALCPRASWQSGWTFLGCFGFEAGRLGVSRTGLSGGHDTTRRLLMGSAGGRLSYQFGPRWAGVAQASVLLPFRQDRFLVSVDGETRELFEVSVVPWVAGLGVSFTL